MLKEGQMHLTHNHRVSTKVQLFEEKTHDKKHNYFSVTQCTRPYIK